MLVRSEKQVSLAALSHRDDPAGDTCVAGERVRLINRRLGALLLLSCIGDAGLRETCEPRMTERVSGGWMDLAGGLIDGSGARREQLSAVLVGYDNVC